MAENMIVAEDGSLIPTGDTQVEQVGEATYDANTADSDLSTVVGGADSSDSFALPGDEFYSPETGVTSTDGGSTGSTSGDTTVLDSGGSPPGPAPTTDSGGLGSGSGVIGAVGAAAVALFVGVVALLGGGN